MEAEAANSRDAEAVVPERDGDFGEIVLLTADASDADLGRRPRMAALGACFACAGGCAPAARRGSLQRAPKVQASGKLRIELLYEPINH